MIKQVVHLSRGATACVGHVTVSYTYLGKLVVRGSFEKVRFRGRGVVVHTRDGGQAVFEADGAVRMWESDGEQKRISPPAADSSLFRLAARVLPESERGDWLEEQRGYLADLGALRARWRWIAKQLMAMPRYAYTVRTGAKKESA
ncbi:MULTISPECIES: hypothetical protein [Streptomyces]|uniref:Uncharacterized protein n=2 Tax=Streptomyces TaxID=1883 RepID=A0ABV9J8H8_9ACTN